MLRQIVSFLFIRNNNFSKVGEWASREVRVVGIVRETNREISCTEQKNQI